MIESQACYQPCVNLCYCQEPDDETPTFCDPFRGCCFCNDDSCEPFCPRNSCARNRVGFFILAYDFAMVPFCLVYTATWCCFHDCGQRNAENSHKWFDLRKQFALCCLAFIPCCFPRDGMTELKYHWCFAHDELAAASEPTPLKEPAPL